MYTAAVLLTALAAHCLTRCPTPSPPPDPPPSRPCRRPPLRLPVRQSRSWSITRTPIEVARDDLKGRHSAGESFLSAFLATTRQSEALAIAGRDDHFQAFEKTVKDAKRPLLTARRVARQDIKTLRERGLVHLPVPGLAEEARLRSFFGDDTYAISGVTHTILVARRARGGVAVRDRAGAGLGRPDLSLEGRPFGAELRSSPTPRSNCARGSAPAPSPGR